MSDDDYRLEKRKEKIQNDKKLNQDTRDFLLNEYVNEVARSGADKKSTQEMYLRRAARILKKEDLETTAIKELDNEELRELNNKIVDNVQSSKYKQTQGEHSVRTKRGFYGSWKRLLQALNIDTSEYKDYMPKNVQFSSQRGQVNKKKITTAQDLPNTEQVKQFLKTLGEISNEGTALRNQALVGLIWDTGPRIGEVIEDDQIQTIKMEQVSVNNDRIHIKFKPNKNKTEEERKEKERKVEILQCRKLLMDYIETHPKRNDPEAFLFPPVKNNQNHSGETRFYTAASKSPIRRKIHQALRKAELEFKTRNEPFHIFRKGMITYYVMNNNNMSWEKVCERTGKDPSSTMPTYLKMAMSDINAQAAEGFGLDREIRQDEHRMIGPPLLPRKCTNCGTENKCFKETCTSCGNTLPDAEMPNNLDLTTKQEITEEVIDIQSKIQAKALKNPDLSPNEITQQILNEENNK